MPTDRIRVFRVTSAPTRNPRVTSFLIDGENEQGFLVQYETINELKASACERAKVKNHWIDLVWRDSRYGRELVGVDLGECVA